MSPSLLVESRIYRSSSPLIFGRIYENVPISNFVRRQDSIWHWAVARLLLILWEHDHEVIRHAHGLATDDEVQTIQLSLPLGNLYYRTLAVVVHQSFVVLFCSLLGSQELCGKAPVRLFVGFEGYAQFKMLSRGWLFLR